MKNAEHLKSTFLGSHSEGQLFSWNATRYRVPGSSIPQSHLEMSRVTGVADGQEVSYEIDDS